MPGPGRLPRRAAGGRFLSPPPFASPRVQLVAEDNAAKPCRANRLFARDVGHERPMVRADRDGDPRPAKSRASACPSHPGSSFAGRWPCLKPARPVDGRQETPNAAWGGRDCRTGQRGSDGLPSPGPGVACRGSFRRARPPPIARSPIVPAWRGSTGGSSGRPAPNE